MATTTNHRTEQPTTESNWSDLTNECLLNILTRLPLEDRWLGPMLVCKSWLHASKDPSLHTVFDLESAFKSHPIESSRWWTPEFERRVDNMVRSVVNWSEGGVKEIRVRHCSDRSLSLIAQRWSPILYYSHPGTHNCGVLFSSTTVKRPKWVMKGKVSTSL